MADYDLTWKVNDDLPLENAAAVSMCALTAAQGLFYRLGFPCPFYGTSTFGSSVEEPVNVLIYGATTNVAMYAAQLVRIAERTVRKKVRLIGAASALKHTELNRAPFYYDFLVDHRDDTWPQAVRDATGGIGVSYAIDAVSIGATVAKVESTLNSEGRFAAYRTPAIGGYDMAAFKIKPVIGPVWEGLGAEISYHGNIKLSSGRILVESNLPTGVTIPANPETRSFAAAFFEFLGQEPVSGLNMLQPVPTRLMPGGLDRFSSDGFAVLRHSPLVSKVGSDQKVEAHLRPVSMEKLVYKI